MLQSGLIVAGKLVQSPSFWHPFYVMKDARQKLTLEGNWSQKAISEIKFPASNVEQSYVLEANEVDLLNTNSKKPNSQKGEG